MTENGIPKYLIWSQRATRYSLWVALALVVLWGANFSVQKFALNQIGASGFLLARYSLILPLCCVALLLVLRRFNWPKISREQFWALAKIGFIGHTLHVGLVTLGMSLSTPFSSSVILAIGPVFSLLILRYMNGERLKRSAIVGVLVALAGAGLFMSDKLIALYANAANQLSGSANALPWTASLGDLVLVVAAFMFSLHTIKVRDFNEKLGIVTVMTYSTLINTFPLALFALGAFFLAGNQQTVGLATFTWPLILALFYSVVLSAFFGWIIWAWVNIVRGSARSAPLMYLMPPVAGAFSWALGGESFTVIKIVSAVVALAGVAIAQFAGQFNQQLSGQSSQAPVASSAVLDKDHL
jgi:drug/metabolite transporter (DMT)-like permease